MGEFDERPTELSSLAEVESPEVVKGAVRRFRRRMLVRIGIIGVIAVAMVMVIANRDPGTLEERFARAERTEVGAVLQGDNARAAVLSVARLEEDLYGVHLVLMADDLAAGEGVTPGSVARSEAATPLGEGICLEVAAQESGAATEMWIISPPGARTLTVEAVASSSAGRGGAGAALLLIEDIGPPATGGPGEGPPPCELDVLTSGERDEVRSLGTLVIDLHELGVDPRLWRATR